MGELARFALGNLLVVGAGHGVLRVAGLRIAVRDLSWSLGVAYLAGAAAVGILGTLLLVCGLSLALWQLVVLCVALGGAVLRRGGVAPPPGPPLRGWHRLLAAGALITLCVLAVDFAIQPLWTEDAWSIWAVKARSFVELGGIDGPFLSSASVVSGDYPLVVPVLESVALRFAGLSTEFVPLQVGLLFVVFPVALAAVLRARVRPAVLWSVVLGLAMAPALQGQAASAVADVPLAAFFALAGVCGWLWVERGSATMLVLWGLFAAAAVGTKIEGRAFVLVLAVALAWAAQRRGRRLRPLVSAGAAVAASALPWILWARIHSLGNAFAQARGIGGSGAFQSLGRIPEASLAVVREVADPTSWLALTAFVVAVTILGIREASLRSAAAFTAAVTIAALASLVVVYWLTPLDFDYHLATSVRRVVVAPVVFAAAMTPLLLPRPEG